MPSTAARPLSEAEHADLRRLLADRRQVYAAYLASRSEEDGARAFELDCRVCDWLHAHGLDAVPAGVAEVA